MAKFHPDRKSEERETEHLIEQLRARIEQLEDGSSVQRSAFAAAKQDIDRLTAENQRLREDAHRVDNFLKQLGRHDLRSAIDSARGGK